MVHDVAHAVGVGGIVSVVGELVAVADESAADVQGDIAVVLGMCRVARVAALQVAVALVVFIHEMGAHRRQSAAAVHGTQYLAAPADVHRYVAADGTRRDGGAAEAAAAAEDIAVVVRRAGGAYPGVAADVDHGVAPHVAVLAAAEHRAVDDGIGVHRHCGVLHIGTLVEGGALVALAGAEQVAGHRVRLDARHRARHTQGAAAHRHRAVAHHVGILAAAVDARQDMAAGDVHRRVATHTALELIPVAVGRVVALLVFHSDTVGVVARAAAEHIAEEGVAVAGIGGGGIVDLFLRKRIVMGIRVIGQVSIGLAVLLYGVVVEPAVALRHRRRYSGQGRGVGGSGGVVEISHGSLGRRPLAFAVSLRLALAAAYLAAADVHGAVAQHLAVLAAAPHGAHDKGIVADGHRRVVHIAEACIVQSGRLVVERRVGIAEGFGLRVVALARTEHIAQVGPHRHIRRTHLAAADGHRRRAAARAVVLFSLYEGGMRGNVGCIGQVVGAHHGHLAAAEEGVVHIAAAHGHGAVARHLGQQVVAHIALAGAEHEAVVLGFVLQGRAHMAVLYLHQRVAGDRRYLAAAVDGVQHHHVALVGRIHPHLGVGGHLALVDIVVDSVVARALAAAEHTAVSFGMVGVEVIQTHGALD